MGIRLRSFGVRLHFAFELFLALSFELLSALIELLLKLLFGFLLDLPPRLPNDLPGAFDGIIRDIPKLRFRVLGGRIVLIVIDIRFGLSPCIDLLCALAYITGLVQNLRSVVPGLLLNVLHEITPYAVSISRGFVVMSL